MLALVRLLVFGLIALTAVYWMIWLYSRSVRREKLEKAWAEDNPEDRDSPARDAYIQNGMEEYHAGLRPKLILLVYIVPAALVVAALVVTNWN